MPALNLAICREGSTLLQFFINFVFEEKIWRETIRNLSAETFLIRILRDFTQEFLTKFTLSTYILETFAANVQKTSHIREVNNTTPNTSGQLGPLGSSTKKINPWFVSGLADGESSFCITIFRNKEYKLGWCVQAIFQIGLHKRDLALLLQIQHFFGGIGSIKTSKTTNMVIYSVAGIKDLTTVIIPHFLNYPLLTQKAADFVLFQRVVELMTNKAHLTIEGFS